jgi:hypothetical protein
MFPQPYPFFDVDFSGVSLTPGQVYTAGFVSGDSRYDLTLFFRDRYSGGEVIIGGRTGFGTDLAFRVTGSGGVGAVPEPTTWAMMLLGFGAIGASLRTARRETTPRLFYA